MGTSEWTQDGAEFPLIHVRVNQTGKYRCRYLLGTDSSVVALPSDSLELIIQEQNKSLLKRAILITAFSCASILFLLLFLTSVGHCHAQSVVSHRETSRRSPRCLCCSWFVCFSSKSGASQEETKYAQVAKCRHSRTPVPEAEDPEGLIYIQLNPPALNERQIAPVKTCPDPTTYATLALR
ncbi:V-set and transmembrane domain-containing protein 1-like isoform X2 [Vombatus ursinus]|uniref:V-set and transmembrane domain-containing protein 1-like isoform X2 n=1 Tax=Vombatus ursinus TaxID=29139 RepID=UPI000FFD78CA|nr:V-set and transmembrane domain-containing protein 1-like isoform X2 [Vombatus ursinus]